MERLPARKRAKLEVYDVDAIAREMRYSYLIRFHAMRRVTRIEP
jgi:hypothetical protein